MKMQEMIEDIEAELQEASYAGNLGAVEMMQFYRVADQNQQNQMDRFLSSNQISKAWALLQKVVGVRLKPINSVPRKIK